MSPQSFFSSRPVTLDAPSQLEIDNEIQKLLWCSPFMEMSLQVQLAVKDKMCRNTWHILVILSIHPDRNHDSPPKESQGRGFYSLKFSCAVTETLNVLPELQLVWSESELWKGRPKIPWTVQTLTKCQHWRMKTLDDGHCSRWVQMILLDETEEI